MAIFNINKLICPRTSLPKTFAETNKIAKFTRATNPLVNNVDIMFFNKLAAIKYEI